MTKEERAQEIQIAFEKALSEYEETNPLYRKEQEIFRSGFLKGLEYAIELQIKNLPKIGG